MNLKYHGAREAISALIEVPNAAAAHRDALGRGQARAQLHNPIKLLIGSIKLLNDGSITTLIARITTLIVGITPLIVWITTLIAWIIVLIGMAISILIVWISIVIVSITFVIGAAISMVIGVVQEGNGAGIVVGNPAVGGELVEDARDLAGASEAGPARQRAHAGGERLADL